MATWATENRKESYGGNGNGGNGYGNRRRRPSWKFAYPVV